jgi:surface antigen
MKLTGTLMAAAALVAIGATAASAQDNGPPSGDPYGYYSQYDHEGYYDRQGHYQHFQDGDDQGAPPPPGYEGAPPPPPPGYDGPPPPDAYYEEGRYERECHRGNEAAGTIFGAVAGGLLGGAIGHGHGGAVVGGAVLGGLLGNTVSRDIDCDDQPYAFRAYAAGLDGDIGYRTEWSHDGVRGTFTPTREFRRGGEICRDFTETTYSHRGTFTRTGTACRHPGGNWDFD